MVNFLLIDKDYCSVLIIVNYCKRLDVANTAKYKWNSILQIIKLYYS